MRQFFCEIGGWGVADMVHWCCVRRDWWGAYLEGEKGEVFGRGGKVDRWEGSV